ncbi:hypothetical protein BDW74DRAFT_188335 [Aspergillus multicolor]|uniref:fungal specific transcription factor domain-containing protein n=1 Tax=Aspergillus multicolor TaxID=41759 RepID=UPI003CCDD978
MTVEPDVPPTDLQKMLDDFDVQAVVPAPAGLPWPDTTWLDCQWQDISTTSLFPPDLMAVSTTTALTDPLSLDILNESPPPPTTADSSSSRVKMTDLIRAELDQIYFDRVHAFCPIIHRRRYFTFVTQASLTPAQAYLQGAMRTLAATMSAHYQLGEQLYTETRALLETHSHTPATPRDKIPLDHLQAWLLLSHYELLRMSVHQAMLTASRAFRLVQMARLSEIDAGADLQLSPIAPSPSSLLLSGGVKSFEAFNEWPLTLQEEIISTRLPCPEHNYQNNPPIRTPFLPEAMTQTGQTNLSPFSECIIMATLHGRCMTHRRFYANPNNTNASDSESGPTKRDFCIRQNWLSNVVDRRVQMLSRMPSPTVDSDPMLLFTHMLGYRATVHLSDTMQQVSWRTSSVDQQILGPGAPVVVSAVAYQQRAAHAAGEIVRLAKAVPALSPFKAHPFIPDTLACAATFLSINGSGFAGGDRLQHLLHVLGELQDTHSLAKDYLQGLQTPGEENRQDTWFLI